ncbi:MAG: DUF2075 domain-containing protein [Candidatus Omnitrophica bacterium]|jgi:hypothetical protein|nr:DUF2075 domain-containing protein [Candidatus Omnitrophota bacterium]
MRLYSGSSAQFIQDVIQNQIAEKLKLAFFDYFRFYPSPGEINSWRNSLRSISQTFQYANLLDHGIILEYQLPLTSKRLDCLICGKDKENIDNSVIVELKQWDKCEEAIGENEVLTWLGGAKREVLHPSVQVGQYKMYLEDTHTAFNVDENPIRLNACTYLHNYSYYSADVIFSRKFKQALDSYPLFTADDVDKMKDYLLDRLASGMGMEVLKRVEKSKYKPSKKLMDHVGSVVKNKLKGKDVKILGGVQNDYILLDEQLIAYDKVLALVKRGFHDKQKNILIISGGPGTGKSVIALKLLADLNEMHYNAQYATGSKSFTETLRKIVGTRAAAQFKYFLSYADAQSNEIDILICDEAHRIREKTVRRYGRPSGIKQVEEIIQAAKVVVFLIDQDQIVRPGEIGSSDLIKEYANKHICKISEYELAAQFRCNGSDAFINWVNNTLVIRKTANVIWDLHEEFDFKIFTSPFELEKAIRNKVDKGYTGRVTAGFCWEWNYPKEDGTLIDDVIIGDYKRPWDAKHDAKKLALGIPKASFWAYDPNGINQIGCIYTAQGFEFDYVGVIFGEDLKYNFDEQNWVAHKENFADSQVLRAKDEDLLKYLKNIYRVLLTRGIKGCYVYFMDKDTERFFKSRIEGVPIYKEETLKLSDLVTVEDQLIHKIEQDIAENLKYVEYLPVYSLEVAAGNFGQAMSSEEEGWIKTDIGKKLDKRMFVARVVGHSMEPLIPEGRYCIFRWGVEGTRQNKIVLVQHNSIADPDTGGKYTVKKYTSKKKIVDGVAWEHEAIKLLPLNTAYKPIDIPNSEEGSFIVIAEFIKVL